MTGRDGSNEACSPRFALITTWRSASVILGRTVDKADLCGQGGIYGFRRIWRSDRAAGSGAVRAADRRLQPAAIRAGDALRPGWPRDELAGDRGPVLRHRPGPRPADRGYPGRHPRLHVAGPDRTKRRGRL